MPAAADGLWWEAIGREDGSAVLLSPGLGGSAAFWAPQIEPLSSRHRVILCKRRKAFGGLSLCHSPAIIVYPKR